MKLFISLILIFLSATLASAQLNFARYFDEGSIPLFNLDDHLDIKFKWDMKGEIQVHLNEGLNNLDENNPELAIPNFDEVIKIDSLAWLSFYYRGICKRNLSRFDEAEKDLLTAKRLKPGQAEIYVELGEVYQVRKKRAKAIDLYEEAIKFNPQLVNSYFNLGTAQLASGELRKALRLFQKCTEVDPGFPDAYVVLGVLKFRENKKNNESIRLFSDALKADSTYTQAYFWRGVAHVAADQNEKCLADWSKFILFNPGNSFMLMMRGFLLIEMNQFDNAFTDLRKSFLSKTLDEENFKGAQTMLDKRSIFRVLHNT
jgi:tetratricopeptide (TPR) repeat protein